MYKRKSLVGIKFDDLAPNWAFKNIGGFLIWRYVPYLSSPVHQVKKILPELNLAVQASTAKMPSLISLQ